MSEQSVLDQMVADIMPHLPPIEADAGLPSMRDLFLEMLTVSLGNLYSKMPMPGTLYDRSMLKVVTEGVDDNEVAKMTARGEDWMRLEGIIRAAEGQKAYSLNRPTMAVLSTVNRRGTARHHHGTHHPRLLRGQGHARSFGEMPATLGAYFLTRIARN